MVQFPRWYARWNRLVTNKIVVDEHDMYVWHA
jgi:hypothetical protein